MFEQTPDKIEWDKNRAKKAPNERSIGLLMLSRIKNMIQSLDQLTLSDWEKHSK